ncbi:MAG: class I SAM-dependent methyltransferase [Phycisphaerae bacterium]|nr:class I SAM-dependent methyltransferase [Phycisphaerae bacterium]
MSMLEKLLPIGSKRRRLVRNIFLARGTPARLSKNFGAPGDGAQRKIEASIEANCFADHPEGCLRTDSGRKDMEELLYTRVEETRRFIVPWLDAARPLSGSRILEIGCGTGTSTVALVEQGAEVTGIDINERSLNVAKDRLGVHGLDACFHLVNADEIANRFSDRHFDFIIFFASLEHMTHTERMIAMKDAWDLLPTGGLLGVIETPNRLWYHDSHTSRLPFFQWLPDDLALEYSRFSPRDIVRDVYTQGDRESQLAFLRLGRGVSFHEFELTMKPVSQLHVVSCKASFFRRRSVLNWLAWRFSTDRRYASLLARACPGLDRGFLQPFLDIIIRKD